MNLPFYQGSATAAKQVVSGSPKSANTGLWYTRFYDAFTPDWTVDDQGKRNWINRTVHLGASGDREQLKNLADRQQKLCLALGGLAADLQTDGPFVTGMGLSHPVENGFTFHPVLGSPYLPASGVKGLLRGWVDAWMDHDGQDKEVLIGRWFGAAKGNDNKIPEGAGNLIFFDALPTMPVSLACDIMTPHMGQWYEKGGEIKPSDYASVAPADWHSPVPVPFLVVKGGATFRFMIAPRLIGKDVDDAQSSVDVVKAMAELKNALEWLGAGAKTATGYGRMIDRIAEKEQKNADGLAKAGFSSTDERWDNARLTWNKGNATLTVSKEGEKSVLQSGAAGKATRSGLSEVALNRLDKGKPVLVIATIRSMGNNRSLVDIQEQMTC